MSGQNLTSSILNKSRKDKFLLSFTCPPILQETDADPLQFSAYGTITPDINVGSIQVPFGGHISNFTNYKRPEYDYINVNFTIDNKFKNYLFLWKWIQAINDSYSSLHSSRKTVLPNEQQYQTTITVFGLDEYNQQVVKFDYFKAFIVSLGSIQWNYKDSSEIECSFTAAFNQMDTTLLVKDIEPQPPPVFVVLYEEDYCTAIATEEDEVIIWL